jgi:hypothetical protein
MQNLCRAGTGLSSTSVKSSKTIPPIRKKYMSDYNSVLTISHKNASHEGAGYESVLLQWQFSCIIFEVLQ